MISIIIALLGIQLIFTDNSAIDCQAAYDVDGCYYSSENIIYINESAQDQEKVIYHELGHALYLGNSEVESMLEGYEPLSSEAVSSEEKTADYYAVYMKYTEEFRVIYPELAEVFDQDMALLKYFSENQD